MPVALISDLHSNQESLTKVLEDIRSQGITEIYCLGDLVGYGADPLFVVEKAMEWKLTLKGNHDEAVTAEGPTPFHDAAKKAVVWTREQLKPGFLSGRAKKERWKFLSDLPLTHQLDGALLVHGSPRDPTMEYVLRTDCLDLTGGVPEKIRDIFTRFERVCFVGHTHDPGVITEDSRFIHPSECNHEFRFEPGKKYFVNLGSVGQPRDGDPRACYAVYHGDKVVWRRVAYDFKTAMQKIFDTPDLDRRMGDRLAQGR